VRRSESGGGWKASGGRRLRNSFETVAWILRLRVPSSYDRFESMYLHSIHCHPRRRNTPSQEQQTTPNHDQHHHCHSLTMALKSPCTNTAPSSSAPGVNRSETHSAISLILLPKFATPSFSNNRFQSLPRPCFTMSSIPSQNLRRNPSHDSSMRRTSSGLRKRR